MNAREARAIIQSVESGLPNLLSAQVAFYGGTTDYNFAKGYLSGYEDGKRDAHLSVKPVVSKLEGAISTMQSCLQLAHNVGLTSEDWIVRELEKRLPASAKVLAEYKKDALGEP